MKTRNHHRRAGSAEAPIGDYTDRFGTTVRVYPDKNNAVLVELEDTDAAMSVELPAGLVLATARRIMEASGLSMEELTYEAVSAGVISPEVPATRAGRRRHEKMLSKNPLYNKIYNNIESGKTREPAVPGASFMKEAA